jgi:hypothetical protein
MDYFLTLPLNSLVFSENVILTEFLLEQGLTNKNCVVTRIIKMSKNKNRSLTLFNIEVLLSYTTVILTFHHAMNQSRTQKQTLPRQFSQPR